MYIFVDTDTDIEDWGLRGLELEIKGLDLGVEGF